MKNNKFLVLTVIFGLLTVVLSSYIVYDKLLEYNLLEQNDDTDINDNEDIDENNTKETCTFTRTHHIVDLLEDYKGEVPESTFILVDHYLDHYPQVLPIPNTIREGLVVNKNYEFSYTILRNNSYKNENDILNDLVGDAISQNNNLEVDSDVILVIKETDRLGLEQINEDICR